MVSQSGYGLGTDMGRGVFVSLLLAVGTLSAALASQPESARADGPPLAQPSHINVGDLIVDFGMSCGSEECFGQDSDSFDILNPAGEYKGTLHLDGYTSSPAQLAFENSGKIVASDGNEVDRYGHSGGPRTRVILPDEENFPFLTSFALDGPENLYASVSVGGNDLTWRYERFGVAYGSPEEVSVDAMDEGNPLQFVGLFGCTLTYGGWAQFKRYDICTEEQLADYPQAASQFREQPVRVLLDGSVLTVDGGLARRYETDGTVTEYGSGETCIVSTDAYNNILYAVDQCSKSIESYVLSSGTFLTTVKQYDSGELEARDAYPISIRVYGRVAPPKPVIFVHGITTDVTAGNFNALFSDGTISASLTRFSYFQDTNSSQCSNRERPTLLPAASGVSIASVLLDSISSPGTHCDSQSDLAVNSALLHQDIQQAYCGSGGQSVVLVGFSMGGAVIRGALSYSESLQDGVDSTMVDSVFFFESAHDGSYWATCLTAGRCPGEIPKALIDLINGSPWGPQISTSRPAVQQMTPGSAWYQWANSHTLPAIGYYNFYGDIRYTEETSWGGFHRRTKFWFGIGDLVFYPGPSSDPYDFPSGGAARFSRPNTTEQWEWALTRSIPAKVDDRIAAGLNPDAVNDANKSAMTFAAAITLELPELHTNLPGHLGDSGAASSFSPEHSQVRNRGNAYDPR